MAAVRKTLGVTERGIATMSLDRLGALLSDLIADVNAGRIELSESNRLNRLAGKRLRELKKLYGSGGR